MSKKADAKIDAVIQSMWNLICEMELDGERISTIHCILNHLKDVIRANEDSHE